MALIWIDDDLSEYRDRAPEKGQPRATEVRPAGQTGHSVNAKCADSSSSA